MGLDQKSQRLDVTSTYFIRGVRYYIVSKRWGILALICTTLFIDLFSFGFFSFINDLTSVYFRVEPAVTDLQAIINTVGRIVGSTILCFTGHWLNFRNIATLGAAINALGALMIMIGVLAQIYPILALGTFLNGCSSAGLLSLIFIVPTNWFPPDERGKANAASWVSRRISYLFATIISTRAMGVSYTSTQLTHGLNAGEMQNFTAKFKITFCCVFGTLSLLATICSVLSRIYVQEHPPVYVEDDDSKAIADESSPMIPKLPSYDFKRELNHVKYVMTKPSVVLINCLNAFSMVERPLAVTLASSLILKVFPDTDDQFVGIILSVGIIAASIFSPLVGQILDKFSQPRLTFLCLIVFSVISVSLFSVFFWIRNLAGVVTAFLLMWAVRDAVLVCLTHRSMAIISHEPASIRFKAFAIRNIMVSVGISISTAVIRKLLENYGSAPAVLFPIPFLILCFLAYTFLWSYLRDGEWNESASI